MSLKNSGGVLRISLCAAALCAGALVAQQGAAPGGRVGPALGVFMAADADSDGAVTRAELKAAFAKWLSDADTGKTGSVTQDQLAVVVNAAMPQPQAPAGGRGAAPQNKTPKPEDVEKMMAALPAKAPAAPKQARQVLVLAKANGYVHSCIPLAAKTIEALGTKTGAWSTVITYDPTAISTENLKQYDLVFLDNTTGAFLDDPNDPALGAARKAALLAFVRSGKGLAGIHAAADSYHQQSGAGRSVPPNSAGGTLASQMMVAGDKNADKKLSADEMNALADSWFDKLDTEKAGKVEMPAFSARFPSVLPPPPPPAPRVVPQGRDTQVGTWPEFNTMIGGFFKFHWLDPQLITVKIDDPKNPINKAFGGKGFDIHDETYTFGMDTYSRGNLHILTSIDYDKMSADDKAKEDYPRADHDYGLSWIRREGQGRVFYEAHGHNERVYAITPMLEHVLAGVQYAIGDLKADDTPSKK
jgi:type 1 glutamine amidotransferase